MRQFAVIGLGSFGIRVARILAKGGFPVLAVDQNPVRIDLIQNDVTQAIQLNVTVPGALERLGIGDVNTAVVSLGNDFEASVLVTMSLHDLNVRNIVVKGISREHKKILELLGANSVIFPEEDAAIRVARQLSEPNILEQFQLLDGYSIIELDVPESFVNKSLLELNLRREYGVECLAIKGKNDNNQRVIPSADIHLRKNDSIILLAPDENLDQIKAL